MRVGLCDLGIRTRRDRIGLRSGLGVGLTGAGRYSALASLLTMQRIAPTSGFLPRSPGED